MTYCSVPKKAVIRRTPGAWPAVYRFSPGYQNFYSPAGVEVSQPAWTESMTPEQRAVLAPPGLLHGEGRRHGSHQSRPRLAVTGPAPTGEDPTPAAEGEAGEAANFTLNGKVKNAG